MNKRENSLINLKDKYALTMDETKEYTGLCKEKLREISDEPGCNFVFWNGKRRMFKRKLLEEYLDGVYSI